MSQVRRGEVPRRLAVIGDMPHHRDADGTLYALAPVVAQLDRWAELFDEVVYCGPLGAGPPPPGNAPYRSGAKVTLAEVPTAGGNTRRAKLAMLRHVPGWVWRTRQVARSVDAVHLRCPCNIAGVAIFSTWRATPYRYALYAGVWRPYEGEPRFFGYQRRLLASPRFGGPVSVYASADPERPHLEPFFSPSHDEADWEASRPVAAATRARIALNPRSGPWRLVVVGRLTPNKNQAAAIDALRSIVDAGVEATLDLVGDGPEAGRLAERAERLGLAERVRFNGMVDHAQVLGHFAAADLQLLTTRQEGYGKVLLEGMVQGVVPVFSESPVADEIAGGGSRGVVVAADRPEQVARAVVELINDRPRWLAMVDEARAYTAALTLDSFAGRVREMLERQWDVTLPPVPSR